MASVNLSGITLTKGTQADGRINIQHVFTDDAAREYRTPTRTVPANFDVDQDRLTKQGRVEQDILNTELAKYTGIISDDITPEHHTKAEVQAESIKTILRKTELCEVLPLLGSVSFLLTITDQELKDLLGVSNAVVIKIRAWQADMMIVHPINRDYEALI